jgi:hypothetical protein
MYKINPKMKCFNKKQIKLNKIKMDRLMDDVQLIIVSFLKPDEIIQFYNADKTVIDALSKHIAFIVQCTEIISDKTVKWFQEHKINLQLLKTHEVFTHYQAWYQNGKLHRDGDMPAVIRTNGEQQWFQNGKRHRDHDLPAIIYTCGTQKWYQNDKLHRDNDLPAEMYASGTQKWYQNDKLQRDNDLPAIVHEDGSKEWFQNGKRHRSNNKPAIVRSNVSLNRKYEWHIDGKRQHQVFEERCLDKAIYRNNLHRFN